jgi:hypothetical protein
LVSGTFLCAFGTVWGLVSWVRSLHTGVVATTGTVMIAVLPLILGFQLLIQTIVFDVTQVPVHPRSKLWRYRWQNAPFQNLDRNDFMPMK